MEVGNKSLRLGVMEILECPHAINRSSSPHANSLLLKCPKIPFWTGNFVADSLRELHP